MRVRLTRELRLNLTGYDRLPAIYAPGEQDVPAAVAEYIAGHPSWGEVLGVRPEPQGDEPEGQEMPDPDSGDEDDDEPEIEDGEPPVTPAETPKPERTQRKARGKGTA